MSTRPPGGRLISDTRSRILDAAERLIDAEPDAFTMDRVAQRAALSRATVYRHFGSSAGLRASLERERGATPERPSDTRQRILDAALHEFSSSGVHGATIQEIATRAGVTPMTVYNHFDDKEGLVAALIKERGPSGLPLDGFLALESPQAAIEALVHAVLRLVTEQRELIGLVIAPDPITRRAFRRLRSTADDAGSVLAPLLRAKGLPEGVDPRVAAASLMGMVIANGVLRPLLFGDDVGDVEELAAQISRLFNRATEVDEADAATLDGAR